MDNHTWFDVSGKSTIYSKNLEENDKEIREFLGHIDLMSSLKNKAVSKIYIKPNFMTYIHDEGLNYTSIILLKSLCKFLADNGYSPNIIESNMFYNILFPKHNVENVSKRLGIDFNKVINLSNGETVKREYNGKTFEIPKILEDPSSYFLINLPKVKAHPMFSFTCAIKNIYGCFPEPDKLKEFHWKNGIDASIIAINHLIRPDYTVVDAIKCQDKIHDLLPVKDRGYFYRYGFLFASRNSLCIDLLVSSLLGKEPDSILKRIADVYPTMFKVEYDNPPPLKDFRTSNVVKRWTWKGITRIPFHKFTFLRAQMLKEFTDKINDSQYLWDMSIFS